VRFMVSATNLQLFLESAEPTRVACAIDMRKHFPLFRIYRGIYLYDYE
jgi:hypothetical protein